MTTLLLTLAGAVPALTLLNALVRRLDRCRDPFYL